MKKERGKRRTVVISFISGKGGVGKTALAAAVGKLLALMGYKVLLIDSDFTTHGLTFLLGFNEEVQGILELFKETQQPSAFAVRLTLHLSETLDFVQSTSRASLIHSDLVFSKAQELNVFLEFLLDHFSESSEYDFILIDSQAGAVPSTFANVSRSTKTVIVMEPDPVSTYATKNLVGELGDNLKKESYYVINKLSVEEASAYVAIERFLKILNHLPPVPFDFEVRRAFMTRQIPIDEKRPSPFMFGIIRLMRDLLPQTSERLDNLRKDIEEIALAPTRQRIEKTERELDILAETEVELKHAIDELRSEEKRPLYLFRQALLSGLPFLMVLYVLFILITIGFNIVVIRELYWTLTAIFVSITTTIFFYWMFVRQRPKRATSKLRELEKDLALLQEQRARLRGEYESYRALLITRSEELMLKPKEMKSSRDLTESKDQ